MASHTDILTINDVKNTAKIIKTTLKNKFNVEIKHGWALDVSSAVYDYKDWNTASAELLEIEGQLKIQKESFSNVLKNLDSSSVPTAGFISETAFSKVLSQNAEHYGLPKYDSMVVSESIRQVAEEIGIGKSFLFTIGSDNTNSKEISIGKDAKLYDFGRIVKDKRKAMGLALLRSLDPQEASKQMKKKDTPLRRLSIYGMVGIDKTIASLDVALPEIALDDFVYSIIKDQFGNNDNDYDRVYTIGSESREYKNAFTDACGELFGSLENKLYSVRISSAHNYKDGSFMTPDLSIFDNYGVDEFSEMIKNEVNTLSSKKLMQRIKAKAKELAQIIIKVNKEKR